MKKKALIVSIQSTKLSRMEQILLKKEKPWGIILFKRNLKSYNQVKRLTSKIKSLTKNKKFPILIDLYLCLKALLFCHIPLVSNHAIQLNYLLFSY